ncbi:hypothetical protein MMC20_006493 [Loxospora ochrophaea]|nr:hypothetical protein [Loxospora ochrophaea]
MPDSVEAPPLFQSSLSIHSKLFPTSGSSKKDLFSVIVFTGLPKSHLVHTQVHTQASSPSTPTHPHTPAERILSKIGVLPTSTSFATIRGSILSESSKASQLSIPEGATATQVNQPSSATSLFPPSISKPTTLALSSGNQVSTGDSTTATIASSAASTLSSVSLLSTSPSNGAIHSLNSFNFPHSAANTNHTATALLSLPTPPGQTPKTNMSTPVNTAKFASSTTNSISVATNSTSNPIPPSPSRNSTPPASTTARTASLSQGRSPILQGQKKGRMALAIAIALGVNLAALG